MQFVIEAIRKVVVLVLLMELVMQLQVGKEYEPYIKMLAGIMVIYSLVSGVVSVTGNFSKNMLKPMEEFQWSGDWYTWGKEKALEEHDEKQIEVEVNVPAISEIKINEIIIDEIKIQGGTP